MNRWYQISLLAIFICLIPSIASVADFSSPEDTFESYKQSLKSGNVASADSCFTRESLAKGRHHVAGNMQKLYNTIANKSYRIEYHGNRAIVRWFPADPYLQEFYLIKEGGLWKIDCQFMYDNIVYDQNHRCIWKDGDPDVEERWIREGYRS